MKKLTKTSVLLPAIAVTVLIVVRPYKVIHFVDHTRWERTLKLVR